MFNEIGKKLCKVASIIAKIGRAAIVVSVIVALVTFFSGAPAIILCCVAVALIGGACIISSFPLYAFGQIVDDVREIKISVQQSSNTTFTQQNQTVTFTDLPTV